MRSKAPIDNRSSWFRQRAIRNLLYNLLYELDMGSYEPLSEARYDDLESLSGDASIVIIDLKIKKAIVTIQVINSRELIEAKEQALRDLGDFPYLKEVFLFDYETESWYRFMRQSLEEAEDEWEANRDEDEYNPDEDDERDAPSYSYTLRRVMDDFARIGI